MRLRKEPELDPQTLRELEALDAALAGRSVDPRDDELAELAVALHDERPVTRPQFALDLDLRAREGFQTTARAARPPERRSPRAASRRRWGLALGAAASVFIVATGVIGSGVLDSGNGDGKPGGTTVHPAAPLIDRSPGDSAPSAAGGGAAESEQLPAPKAAAPPQPSGGDIAARARDRKVEHAASLTLAPPRDRIEQVADDAIRVTDRHSGFVMSSSISAGEREAGASLDLRIPSTRLQPALADLSELAHVRARTQETRDITAAFRSPRRRLADAFAERRGLLRQLARAVTPNETTAVRARLRAVNRRIDRAQAELRRLRQRVSFSAVSVAIEPGTGESNAGGGWSIGDAVGDALSVLRTMLGAALVALAVLFPRAFSADWPGSRTAAGSGAGARARSRCSSTSLGAGFGQVPLDPFVRELVGLAVEDRGWEMQVGRAGRRQPPPAPRGPSPPGRRRSPRRRHGEERCRGDRTATSQAVLLALDPAQLAADVLRVEDGRSLRLRLVLMSPIRRSAGLGPTRSPGAAGPAG